MAESKETIIENDLKEAMKQKNQLKLSVLRMVKSAIINQKIEKKTQNLDDAGVLAIISKQIKQHKDSIDSFTKGQRNDLVEKEKQELAILESYMPKQLSPEELLNLIKESIKETGASGPQDSGKVIKMVMEKAKGAAEGKTVSQIVVQELSKK